MCSASANSFLPILPVILAGGVGERLAPLSSVQRPKPFIPLTPAGEGSLLQDTLKRLQAPFFLPPVLIGRYDDRFALLNHARQVGIRPHAILLESNRKNTGVAVALATVWAMQHHAEAALMAVFPADHRINPVTVWQETVQTIAQSCASQHQLGVLMAPATYASPAYGYVQPTTHTFPSPIAHFVEKPAMPQPLIESGAGWNMGQFIGRAADFKARLQLHAPAHWVAASTGIRTAQQQWEFTVMDAWPEDLPAEPFDRLVMERAGGLCALFSGHWSDIGTVKAWQHATSMSLKEGMALPLRVDRPWGYYEEWLREPGRCCKRLVVSRLPHLPATASVSEGILAGKARYRTRMARK